MPNTEEPNTANSVEAVSLKKWVEMDQATREQLAQNWLRHDDWMKRQESTMCKIVEEAAKRLSHKLAGCSEVTGVQGVLPGMILVTTSLSEGQKVPSVPEEWSTFLVR